MMADRLGISRMAKVAMVQAYCKDVERKADTEEIEVLVKYEQTTKKICLIILDVFREETGWELLDVDSVSV